MAGLRPAWKAVRKALDAWRRRNRQREDALRTKIRQAIAERRYDLAESLSDRLPVGSRYRAATCLQLLIARSFFEEAAHFYEHANLDVRSQRSARIRYLRSLMALSRIEEANSFIEAAFAARDDGAFLSALLPYLRAVPPAERTKLADVLLADSHSANISVAIGCAQALMASGETARAAQVAATLKPADAFDKSEAALLRMNIAIAQRNNGAAVESLSRAFEAFGLETVSLRQLEMPLAAGNLEAKAASSAPNLPKATVIISCFNAEPSIASALQSLRVQSHADVEILVVDDCSTDKSVDIISQIAADDSRVHLLRAETNGGTYRARNLALTAASGEFVLAHDADDWAHPRKVERLVRHLMDHPESVAVRGRMIRLSESTGAHFRVSYVRPDFSSLTFRREAALRRAGYFDPVRAGADSEYAYRLQRIFGEESVADLKELLSVTSFAGESLSQGGLFSIDMDSGVFSPLRAAYQREYFRWHEHASTLFMSADDGPRPFPAPEEMIRRG